MTALARQFKPFHLLSETMKSYERTLTEELIDYLPEDMLDYIDDVEIEMINGYVCLPLPPDLLIDLQTVNYQGTEYIASRFILVCDPEIV